jgi:electron transfer flavoprotein beta subunit
VKILVTAKRVTDYESKLTLTKDGRIDYDAVDFKMNPFCEIAVEEALRLVDAAGDGETIVVAVGDSDATKEIRTAMAMGCDRGILVEADEDAARLRRRCPRARGHLRQGEARSRAARQAGHRRRLQPGRASSWPSTWAGPRPPSPTRFALNGTSGATVQREVDGGVETVSLTFPAVITTDLRLNEPRYASLPGIMKAKKKPLEETTAADLGVDLALKVESVGFEPPPARRPV